MNSRPCGTDRPVVFEDLKVRTLHRDQHWRVNVRTNDSQFNLHSNSTFQPII